MTTSSRSRLTTFCLLLLAAAGCDALLGGEDFEIVSGSGGTSSGAGGAGAVGGSGGTTGGGGAVGGSGGATGGGGAVGGEGGTTGGGGVGGSGGAVGGSGGEGGAGGSGGGGPGALAWAKRFGDSVGQKVEAVAVDGDGNIIVVGEYGGIIDFGGAPLPTANGQDAFVAKLTPDGVRVWSLGLGGAGEQSAYDVAVDFDDNVVVVGGFSDSLEISGLSPYTCDDTTDIGDGFVVKLTSAGSPSWGIHLDADGRQTARAVAIGAANDVVVSGEFVGTVNFAGEELTASQLFGFVMQTDSAGAAWWAVPLAMSGSGSIQTRGLAFGETGTPSEHQIVVTGQYDGSLTVDGTTHDSSGVDVFLAALDVTDGSRRWSYRYGDSSGQMANSVAISNGAQVALGGGFMGTLEFDTTLTASSGNDAFLAMGQSTGASLSWDWSSAAGSTDDDWVEGLAVDAQNSVIATGRFRTSIDFGGGTHDSAGGDDVFLVKLDASGDEVWAKAFGTTGNQQGRDVAVDADGNVILVGLLNGQIDFGSGILTSAGGTDVFVAKFGP